MSSLENPVLGSQVLKYLRLSKSKTAFGLSAAAVARLNVAMLQSGFSRFHFLFPQFKTELPIVTSAQLGLVGAGNWGFSNFGRQKAQDFEIPNLQIFKTLNLKLRLIISSPRNPLPVTTMFNQATWLSLLITYLLKTYPQLSTTKSSKEASVEEFRTISSRTSLSFRREACNNR